MPDSQSTATPEAISPLGPVYHADRFSGAQLTEQETVLAELRSAHEADPADLAKLLAYGRQLAFMWRYRDSIEIYSNGLTDHPLAWELYRFRGHRYISTRRYAEAEADLDRAAELHGDNFEICYHLGLARWLRGDFAGAAQAYRRCYAVTGEDSHKVAIVYWLYLALLRTGQEREAQAMLAVDYPPDVGDNVHYHRLLEVFRANLTEQQLLDLRPVGHDEGISWYGTVGYGLGAWHLLHGRTEQAVQAFRQVMASRHWSAFGFIAAETELAQLNLGLEA